MTSREAPWENTLPCNWRDSEFGLGLGESSCHWSSGGPRNISSKVKQRVCSGNSDRESSGRLENEPWKETELKKCPRVERGPDRELAFTSAQLGLGA